MTAQPYCLGESDNACKAALTTTLAGHDQMPRHVDFFHGAARGAAFRAINPKGEVPVPVDRIAALPGWKHPCDMMPGNPSARA